MLTPSLWVIATDNTQKKTAHGPKLRPSICSFDCLRHVMINEPIFLFDQKYYDQSLFGTQDILPIINSEEACHLGVNNP